MQKIVENDPWSPFRSQLQKDRDRMQTSLKVRLHLQFCNVTKRRTAISVIVVVFNKPIKVLRGRSLFQPSCHWQEKKPSFSYLGDFLIACLDVFQQVKEMKGQKCQNTTLLSLVFIYLFILFSTIKITQALHYTKMWRGDLKNHKACMRRPPRYNNIKQQNISTTQQRRIQDALSI